MKNFQTKTVHPQRCSTKVITIALVIICTCFWSWGCSNSRVVNPGESEELEDGGFRDFWTEYHEQESLSFEQTSSDNGLESAPKCGNGKREGTETCDGKDVNGASCLDMLRAPGELTCSSDCKTIDYTGCGLPCEMYCLDQSCGLEPACNTSCGSCPNGLTCDTNNQCGLPCRYDLFDNNQLVDLDLVPIKINGSVSFNQKPIDYPTSLFFQKIDSRYKESVWLYHEPNPTNEYTVWLYPGIYDIWLAGAKLDDSDDNSWKSNVLLEKDLVLTNSQRLDLNANPVLLECEISLNGSPPPCPNQLRIQRLDDYSDYWYVEFPTIGPTKVQTELAPGRYLIEVLFLRDSDESICPQNAAILLTNQFLQEDLQVRLDVGSVLVQGVMTVAGQMPPSNDQIGDRGTLDIYNSDTGDEIRASLPNGGSANYQVRLVAGHYDVSWRGNSTGALPNWDLKLKEKIDLTHDRRLDFDLPRIINLSGEIQIDGKPFPDNPESPGWSRDNRGDLYLRHEESGKRMQWQLGQYGPVAWQAQVFAGERYDLYLIPEQEPFQVVMPEATIFLYDDQSWDQSQFLLSDLKTIDLNGEITVNGNQMPEGINPIQNERGSVVFVPWVNLDPMIKGGIYQGTSFPITRTGGAKYTGTLIAGRYRAYLAPPQYPYPDGNQEVLPDSFGLLVEDLWITSNSTLNFDAKTITLTGSVTQQGQPLPYQEPWPGEPGCNHGIIWYNARHPAKAAYQSSRFCLNNEDSGVYQISLYRGCYDILYEPYHYASWDKIPRSLSMTFAACCSE